MEHQLPIRQRPQPTSSSQEPVAEDTEMSMYEDVETTPHVDPEKPARLLAKVLSTMEIVGVLCRMLTVDDIFRLVLTRSNIKEELCVEGSSRIDPQILVLGQIPRYAHLEAQPPVKAYPPLPHYHASGHFCSENGDVRQVRQCRDCKFYICSVGRYQLESSLWTPYELHDDEFERVKIHKLAYPNILSFVDKNGLKYPVKRFLGLETKEEVQAAMSRQTSLARTDVGREVLGQVEMANVVRFEACCSSCEASRLADYRSADTRDVCACDMLDGLCQKNWYCWDCGVKRHQWLLEWVRVEYEEYPSNRPGIVPALDPDYFHNSLDRKKTCIDSDHAPVVAVCPWCRRKYDHGPEDELSKYIVEMAGEEYREKDRELWR